MSLIGTLNLAGNALAVQQAAIQTTSNNVANAGNTDYTRETADLSPNIDQQYANGIFVGTGVDLTSITRQIDEALQQRLNGATSDASAAATSSNYLGQLQTTLNALGDTNLSTQFSSFFSAWSNLANDPTNTGDRQVVVQDGASLASYVQNLGTQLGDLQQTINTSIANQASSADTLASQIATLNGQIVTTEQGATGSANNLEDQRDALLKQLSGIVDIKSVNQPDGSVDVYVGSQPLVTGTTNNGVGVKQETVDGEARNVVTFKNDNGNMIISSGSLAGLNSSLDNANTTLSQLNGITSNLINAVNKVHASGQGTEGFTSVTATNAVTDTTAALSDATKTGLTYPPSTGSFVVHVTNTTTGLTTSTLLHVDENGTGTDTTLDSLTAQLNGISNVTATDSNGKLAINSSDGNTQITFSDDTSGTLAALGINTFFTGKDATDIGINSTVSTNLAYLAAGQNGDSSDNTGALAIATLGDTAQTGLNGQSLNQAYQSMVNVVATNAQSAANDATATSDVQTTLQNQRENLSGVDLDEETVNLMQAQRAFQGSARVISTVNTLMDELMNLIT